MFMEHLVDRQIDVVSNIKMFADDVHPYRPLGIQVGHSGAAVFLSEVARQRNDSALRSVAASHLRLEAAYRNTAPISLYVGYSGTIAAICLSDLINEPDFGILAARLAHSAASEFDTIVAGDLINGVAGVISPFSLLPHQASERYGDVVDDCAKRI